MRESARNFMVGIASIGGLLGLSGLMMSFGEFDSWFNPRYSLTIQADNAAGLKPGGNVEFNGVPVGVVSDVTIESGPNPVRIHLLINEGILLPSNVEPFATAPLIGGSALLKLQVPPGQAEVISTFPIDGTGVIPGPIKSGMFDQLTQQLDQRMKPIMESLEKFNQLSETFNELGQNLNTLVQPQSESQLAGGEAPNLRTAVMKLNATLDKATEGLSLAKDWLSDETLNNDLRESVTKAKALIDNATKAVDRYTELAQSLQTSTKSITDKLLPVADQLAVTLEDVRRLTNSATQGPGTIGQLMANPDLYNSLNDAATRLERTLVDVQLLIQKFKNEGVIIKF